MILYLHGFRSSSRSWKAEALKAALAARGEAQRFFAPDLPWEPQAAIQLCEAHLTRHPETTLVGSSLGGFYATWLAERHQTRAVLVNPAVLAAMDPESWLGEHRRLHENDTFTLTQAHIEQLRRLEIRKPTPERYLLLLETGDEVLDYRAALAHYAGSKCVLQEGGNHGFVHFPEYIDRILAFAGSGRC
jgi:predicted esterase YcpF (UPF0227 family)